MEDARFSRLERMVGPEGIDRLRRSHVVVVGLGAVGSYAVEALARASVGRLRLVDFDEIRPTNLNRQLYALTSTLGLPKVEAARTRVLDINPDCRVEALPLFVHAETLERVLEGPPDLVVDAIDALQPKVALLAETVRRGIRVVSSMGAALRTDPARVKVSTLERSERCPLARHVRARLRRLGLRTDFPVVYSDEPTEGLRPEAVGEPGEDSERTLARGRPRATLGSLPTLTGIFGLVAANTALEILLGDLWPRTGRKRSAGAQGSGS